METDEHDHDKGLSFDLTTLGRRRALQVLGGVGLLALVGCASDAVTSGATTTASSATTGGATTTAGATSTAGATTTAGAAAASCDPIPEETAGPYPGDGSNGPNVLTESGVVRSDITSSFGSFSGTAEGVPLTVTLTVTDTSASCAPLAGAAVYLWHCDREGRYSLYSQGATDQNYLRGVQETDANGQVTFQSIFPAAYSGRWPHIHFEVYPSLAEATSAGSELHTSQLAFPEDVCNAVYATDGYSASVSNMARTSLSSDNVFGEDDAVQQMATMSGNVETGYTATLAVPI